MTALEAVVVLASVVATGLADRRWWLVAQREHYLPGSATRFALRWWVRLGPNRLLAAAAVLGVVLSPLSPFTGLVGVAAIGAGPFRFPWRGRSPGPLRWTTRVRTVAAVTGALQAIVVGLGVVLGVAVPVAAVVALLSPLAVDAALAILVPVEEARAGRFVEAARARLADIDPTVMAITGSYGKTTTKVYAAHLISGTRTVVPTPASFNNRAGLSRAVNEGLSPGTEVFIAEMGTYGPGEIAELCAWCHPRISAITAIGPVHLERFGDEDAIVRAKSEVLAGADVAVLNIDDPRLAALADRQEMAGQRVVRCSAVDPTATVSACPVDGRLVVRRAAEVIADIEAPEAVPANVAVAVALALEVGVPPSAIGGRLEELPGVPNRRARTTLSTGAVAIDDTFNSNPAGCRAALSTLGRLASTGTGAKRVVVTPGMVELGKRQAEENAAFAGEAAAVATQLVVVGFTNRAALLAGVGRVPAEGRAEVLVADTHALAVAWVRSHTGPGDVVLYENQLPDHYP